MNVTSDLRVTSSRSLSGPLAVVQHVAIRNGYSRYPYPYRVLLARTSNLAHVFANFNSNELHFLLLVTVYLHLSVVKGKCVLAFH